MAWDAPDWQGMNWKIEATLRPNVIYPTGRVMFIDDFERTSSEWTFDGSTGATTQLTTTDSFAGNGSAQIETPSVSGKYARMRKGIHLPESKKIGVEMKFKMEARTGVLFSMELLYLDGTNETDIKVRYDASSTKWQYHDSDGNWTDISGGTQRLSASINSWNHVKLIGDFDNNKYIELRCNDLVVDLSSLSGQKYANSSAPMLGLYIMNENSTSGARWVYVDDVVVTEELT